MQELTPNIPAGAVPLTRPRNDSLALDAMGLISLDPAWIHRYILHVESY